jgi:hypothetical protein
MEENNQEKHVVNNFEAGANCQVFNGNITGCVFAMPGATVTQQQASADSTAMDCEQPEVSDDEEEGSEELCHFIHPSVDSRQEWQVHNEVKRLASRQGIQDICRHLQQMRRENKLLLPQSPSIAYEELVRMGMPSGNGFNESTFRKYYSNK